MEILESLGIDIRQIITTILGFGVFYWVLSRFAWGPFMKMLDERKQTITRTFVMMEEEKKDINDLKEKYETLLANIDNERHLLIQKSLVEAKALAQKIQDEAHEKADQIVKHARESADREFAQAKLELRNYMVDLSIRSAELALKETITDEGHRRIIRKYIEELSQVESESHEV